MYVPVAALTRSTGTECRLQQTQLSAQSQPAHPSHATCAIYVDRQHRRLHGLQPSHQSAHARHPHSQHTLLPSPLTLLSNTASRVAAVVRRSQLTHTLNPHSSTHIHCPPHPVHVTQQHRQLCRCQQADGRRAHLTHTLNPHSLSHTHCPPHPVHVAQQHRKLCGCQQACGCRAQQPPPAAARQQGV